MPGCLLRNSGVKDIIQEKGLPRKGQKEMRSFFHKQPAKRHLTYNTAEKTPVIRCSICTGEQVAGFRRKTDGSFEEVMLIRGEGELRQFKDLYGIEGEIEKIY